ncbi:hypothetical protein [Rhodococcus pyridinivorans]|uniref:hypothetical protein n=1 Tax=Rhodococcus pyridinivorans TaxID=103816 RepID=UPI003AAF18BE
MKEAVIVGAASAFCLGMIVTACWLEGRRVLGGNARRSRRVPRRPASTLWPTLCEHRHRILGWMWILLAVPALLWWQESILFVILMSIYANAEASFAAHEAKKRQH